jgi:hypothetical protein
MSPAKKPQRVGDHEPLYLDEITETGVFCATKPGLGSFRVVHVEVRSNGATVERKPYTLDGRPLPSTEELRRVWVFYGPTDEVYAKGFCSKFDPFADKIFA